MKIAFIGYGEAAGAFRASLGEQAPELGFSCYDILFDTQGPDGAVAQRAARDGVTAAPNPETAVDGATLIVSAVTAASSLDAARAVAQHTVAGQIFVDINSVSPDRKRQSAALFAPGVEYVDLAVMTPARPRGHHSPSLLAGASTGTVATLRDLGFGFEIAEGGVGAATAIKMVRSLFVKGLEAIMVETLLAAEATGCLDHMVESLDEFLPGLGFPELALYQFERTLRHGVRRAAEMRESAVTIDALGLEGGLAAAIADVEQAMGDVDLDDLPEGDRLGDRLSAVLARRLAARRAE